MIYLGSDHGGFALKERLKKLFLQQGVASEDCGALQLDADDDYPEYAAAVAKRVQSEPEARGILLCRSGAGMVIAANRFKGIRAVEVWDEQSVIHAREHNDANIIALSADWLNQEQAEHLVSLFLATPFSGDERHVRRIQQLDVL